MYNIIIIGAGVVGAQVARRLARYKLDILVLEKENDVGDGASGANSAIVHSGYDPEPGTLKAKLNVLGNQMYDEICKDFSLDPKRLDEYRRCVINKKIQEILIEFEDFESRQLEFLNPNNFEFEDLSEYTESKDKS